MQPKESLTRRSILHLEPLESRVHLSVARPATNTGAGFFVANGRVYDANGNDFVMRGVNQNQWWGNAADNLSAIDQAAKTGANAVRSVFFKDLGAPSASGSDTPAERKAIVEKYIADNLVPIVEDHGATENENNAINDPAALAKTVDTWLDPANLSWLKTYEPQVILNIANEWGPPWSATNHVWRDSYLTQVQRLRTAGVKNLIMIDAGGWGQDVNTLKNDAQSILTADPQHNIVFSIHFYSQWRTDDRNFDLPNGGLFDVQTELSAIQNLGLPIVVGEFAGEGFESSPYRTRRILEVCSQLDVGYMGWGWSNVGDTLNMVYDNPATGTVEFQYNSNADLTSWGDAIINEPDYGIKATARRATIFPAAEPVRLILEKTTVYVPETGQALARVRLSKAPSTSVTVSLAKVSGGDADLNFAGATNLIFTPGNWNQYQPILLAAAADADSTVGTARFQLSSAGLQTVDFTSREIDSAPPIGAFTLTPTQDRDTQSDVSAGTNATVYASKWNYFFTKFDLSNIGGKISSAVLRLYKTQSTPNTTARIWQVLDDNWTQAGAVPMLGFPILSQVMSNGVGYVDFNITSAISQEMLRDRTATIAITTDSDNWTPFNTKEAAAGFRPLLVISATEAVPPQLVASAFDQTTSPNRISFTFNENVQASLGNADVLLESLTNPGQTISLSATPIYDASNTAVFTFAPTLVPDGNYRATLLSAGVADAASNSLLLNSTLDFFALGADANHDGRVNALDFNALAANFGSANLNWSNGNFNYDNKIDSADFTMLANQFGASLPAPAMALSASSVVLASSPSLFSNQAVVSEFRKSPAGENDLLDKEL